MTIYPGAAAIATLLAGHGYKKGSLSASGAIAAWLVGYGHLANPCKVFGVAMIAFYLIGSRATKHKAAIKAKLEDGLDPDKPSGNRNWVQVLSNSTSSLIAALVYRFVVADHMELGPSALAAHPLSRPLIFAALGHFSTTLADTLASELGILSPTPPRSILTFRPVPPGTNGGITFVGVQWSVLGGLFMGLIMAIDLFLEGTNGSGRAWDYMLKGARSGGRGFLFDTERIGWGSEMLFFGMAAGLAGSLLDSFLGATLQQTIILPNGKIKTDHSRPTSSDHTSTSTSTSTFTSGAPTLSAPASSSQSGSVSASASASVRQPDQDESSRDVTGASLSGKGKRVGVGRDVLSNSGVNAVCSFVMAGVGYWYGSL